MCQETLSQNPVIEMPQVVKSLILAQTDVHHYGCGGAAVGHDGNVYLFPKITSKGLNERGAHHIGHGLLRLDPSGVSVLQTLSDDVLHEAGQAPITYKDQDAEGNPSEKTHWAYYTDYSLSSPLRYTDGVVSKDGGSEIEISEHPGPEGHEDMRVTRLDNGQYMLTAVRVDAKDWWDAGWKDKTSRIKGCRMAATLSDGIHSEAEIRDTHQIGPDFVVRNAFFTHEVREVNGEPHLRLIYRDLPGEHPASIYQSFLPYGTVIRLASDPKFREEFWRKELSDERKRETLLMTPKFHWEAVRENDGYGHGQIASGCSVKIDDTRTLLVTGSPTAISEKGVTLGRVIGLSILTVDPEDPSKISVTSRAPEPFITPTEDDEIEGKVGNVVSSTGAVIVYDERGEKQLNVYYTGADSCLKLARTKLSDTLDWLQQFDANGEIALGSNT